MFLELQDKLVFNKMCHFCSHCSVTKTELAAHTETLLTNLFMAMTKEGSQENEYVMKGM